MPKFTVIGYYEDNGQRFGTCVEAENWVEAVKATANVTNSPSTLVICDVIAGDHRCLTEGMYVENLSDYIDTEVK